MFRWCSYCQTFMGESEPRTDFSLTHGICIDCKAKTKYSDSAAVDLIQPIKKFFEKLQKSVLTQDLVELEKVIAEANTLNVNSSDLLAGIMQPLLYDIGKLYSEGKIAIHQEHKFSIFINELLFYLNHLPDGDSKRGINKGQDVLIACANGNNHTFGVSFLQMLLSENHIATDILIPGLPTTQIIDYAYRRKFRIIGISISDESQLLELTEVIKLLNSLPDYHPHVIVGGFTIRKETPKIDGITFFSGSISELITLLKSKLI